MAKKRKKRRAFPVQESAPARSRERVENIDVIDADEPGFGVFGYFRNPGVRETIESIIIAILLAFMFKTYEAEAFVIPTGSMSPSLQGEHLDHDCAQCGYRYLTGFNKSDGLIEKTTCPVCNFRTKMDPAKDSEHRTNSGDRILVNKFIYDFNEPERFDVVVFKYPNNAKQNYIKRLIGLPGDNILIENGDIYTMYPAEGETWTREIARKPSRKVKQVLIEVDDTKYISGKLKAMKWPSRWDQWGRGDAWSRNANESMFLVDAKDSDQWLRYRHLIPREGRTIYKGVNNPRPVDIPSDWSLVNAGELPEDFAKPVSELPPGALISDFMSYNLRKLKKYDQIPPSFGNHWVGDLGIEAWMDIESSTGEVLFDLVEGGAHFTCRIDVSSGLATLECADSSVEFFNDQGNVAKPTAETSLSSGSNEVLMVNADDQIHLWVNGSLVEFDASTYRCQGVPMPSYSVADPGDAEPVAIGARNLSMTVSRLKVVRDIYYSSIKGDPPRCHIGNETGDDPRIIREIMTDPTLWSSQEAIDHFTKRRNLKEPMFTLKTGQGGNRDKDQFLPMGDNSTRSSDARVWTGPNRFFERDMLIGRAIYVYWPHTLNEPIPYFPNFGKMKFIR
jgi:signal peptidase I